MTDGGEPKATVLVVCTANICRSPSAELLLRRQFAERGIPTISVTSAGISARNGDPIDDVMSSLLAADGLDATGFSSRRLDDADVIDADLILTATRQHRSAVVQRVPRALRKTFTLLEFVNLAAQSDEDTALTGVERLLSLRDEAAAQRNMVRPQDLPQDIVDPYGRRGRTYRHVYEQINQALTTLGGILSPSGLTGRPN